jgi:hypothetical protein
MSGQKDTDDAGYTRVKAYRADDNYADMVSGNKDIEDFATKQEICSECGLAARSKKELQDHIDHAHKEAK